jgi:asparagine synthase (glutamine-hydrolysing)
MCGIAGLIMAPGAPPPSAASIQALAGALRHRGPDGAGVAAVGRVALIHTRLAIVDPAGGDQPLFAGAAALIANGEIYNDLALRAAMPEVSFATHSDCEPAVQLWLRDGAGFAAGLRGMFALAVHDRAARTVALSRDPFGIKPLYLAAIDGGLAFASEPQALFAAGLLQPRLRPAARDELLQIQFTTGAETIFEGVSRVLPGETLIVADGHVLERRQLEALPEGGAEAIDEDAALARLDAALMESVELHQRSDVPFGMFLSGGIDSASILAVMARLNRDKVLAYTAGFASPGAADERARAADLAKAVGARHETLEITEQMVWDTLPDIVAAMDDPAADYAIIPTWLLGQRARQDVKVVLCGEGGDEIFAGYGRYRHAMRPTWLGGRLMRGRGNFDRVDVLRRRPVGWRDGIVAADTRAATAGRSRLAVAQATDVADWLPHDLLLKLDRCLMAHGVEGRVPLLDPAIAAAGFRLPDALKVRQGMGKYLLRQWLARHLPAARPFEPKQGFSVPIGAWIAGQGSRLGELVAAQPGIQEIADPSGVITLFKNAAERRAGNAAWSLLFYALWHRRHINGLKPVGDVFQTLATK